MYGGGREDALLQGEDEGEVDRIPIGIPDHLRGHTAVEALNALVANNRLGRLRRRLVDLKNKVG